MELESWPFTRFYFNLRWWEKFASSDCAMGSFMRLRPRPLISILGIGNPVDSTNFYDADFAVFAEFWWICGQDDWCGWDDGDRCRRTSYSICSKVFAHCGPAVDQSGQFGKQGFGEAGDQCSGHHEATTRSKSASCSFQPVAAVTTQTII